MKVTNEEKIEGGEESEEAKEGKKRADESES